ncbi:hypothetical protein RhiirA1_541992 [Rhizophagus irregularis]|uniref:Uncharacterized protein n=1 Tax=Rhizophagus irregularis TaxID=588596 RepID=A0A2N0R032_9GLOM|nr:hypothetical protein RhiirA1_541992 [Rhizophagus irregularis]
MSSIKARIYTIEESIEVGDIEHTSLPKTQSINIPTATPSADAAPINHVPPDESSLDSSTNGKSYPAKWERIVIEDEDVYSFKDNLEILVQSQLEVQVIFQEYYITSYNMKKKGD